MRWPWKRSGIYRGGTRVQPTAEILAIMNAGDQAIEDYRQFGRDATAEMERIVGDPWSWDHGWGLRTADEKWAAVEKVRRDLNPRSDT